MTLSYTLFPTPIGTCGVAWNAHGIVRIQLPERDEVVTERLLSATGARPETPPDSVSQVMARLATHLSGCPQCFDDVAIDLSSVTPFYRRVYEEARRIPSGQTRLYRDLAESLGQVGAARAVGQAMARNPMPILIPCHRVTSRDGKGGGFSAFGGLETKQKLMALEGPRHGTPCSGPDLPCCLWDGNLMRTALDTLRRKDEKLVPLLDAVGACGLSPEHAGNPYAALAESIIYQQLAGKAAAAIVRRFVAVFDDEFPTPEALLATPDEALRGAGLSSAKISALRALSSAVLHDGLDLCHLSSQPEARIREALVALRGIGPWTVDMFLIFHLGRPDILPVGDLGIRKAVQQLYRLRQLPDPARMEKLTTRWKPYRTVATWYLWRSLGVTTPGN